MRISLGNGRFPILSSNQVYRRSTYSGLWSKIILFILHYYYTKSTIHVKHYFSNLLKYFFSLFYGDDATTVDGFAEGSGTVINFAVFPDDCYASSASGGVLPCLASRDAANDAKKRLELFALTFFCSFRD